MWTQFTIDGKTVLVNMAMVSHVFELPEGQRGCKLYLAPDDFLTVDQVMREVMTRLGIDPRT
jgi:replicative superfamily II helicase